jgi:hypothetical protein
VKDVAIAGSHAFVADAATGLTVLSIAQPDAPVPVATLPLSGSPWGVVKSGAHLIVSKSGSQGGLSVIDVSDPTAPIEVATYDVDGVSVPAVLDTLVIAATSRGTTHIVSAPCLGEPTEVAAGITPAPFALRAYPNPFSRTATIEFELPRAMEAEVTVYDAAGRTVRALRAGQQTSGTHRFEWDGRDDAGRGVASGVYFVRVRSDVGTVSRKLVTLK